MHLRPVTVSLLLGATAIAQVQNPIPPAPTPAPAAKPAAQDPDKPQPSADQTLQELSTERDRLAREIAYAKERAKNVKALLAEKLGPKKQTWKAIDAGAPPAMMQQFQPTTPRQARLATPEELAAQGQDTLLVVNGHGVAQRSFDGLMTYLATNPVAGDEAGRATRALFELIKLEAIAAQFGENEALERAAEIANELEKGKPMAEFAKSVATVPGASAEGKIEVTRNSALGPVFEQYAFMTEAGKRTRPFRGTNGLVILQVESNTKGERPELDKVTVSAVVVPYTPDAKELQRAHNAVNEGQVDLWVRDQKTIDMLPAMFRRPAPAVMAAPVQSPEAVALQRQIQEYMKELGTLQGKTDDAAKAKMQELARQIGEAETKLRALRAAATGADGAVDDNAARAEDTQALRAALDQIQTQIGSLEKDGSDEAKARLKMLNEQYAQIKTRLKQAERTEATKPVEGGTKPPAKKT